VLLASVDTLRGGRAVRLPSAFKRQAAAALQGDVRLSAANQIAPFSRKGSSQAFSNASSSAREAAHELESLREKRSVSLKIVRVSGNEGAGVPDGFLTCGESHHVARCPVADLPVPTTQMIGARAPLRGGGRRAYAVILNLRPKVAGRHSS
jgi:hypothetical protein